MSRSARKAQPVVATIEVSPKQLLAAHRQGAIVLTKAERTAFRGAVANVPVILREDQKLGQQMKAWLASKAENAVAVAGKVATPPARIDWSPETPTPVLTEKQLAAAVEIVPEPKKAKRAKKAEAETPAPKRAPKGQGKSRTPEARKARRILREYLRVSLIATDENEDAEIREIAAARAAHLEQLIGEAV